MAEHRYDVQAALYLLACTACCGAAGCGLRPRQHLGGAIYFFLRGLHGPARGCVHVAAQPALLDALDAMLGAASDADQGQAA
jgi:exodeoxyribonuclease V beta subunit